MMSDDDDDGDVDDYNDDCDDDDNDAGDDDNDARDMEDGAQGANWDLHKLDLTLVFFIIVRKWPLAHKLVLGPAKRTCECER